MKKIRSSMLYVAIALTLLFTGIADSNAARMGGGKSFGSRPSYSAPYSRSAGSQASPSQPGYQQPSPAAAQNQAARGAMGNRGGFMGMLGGLALGGLLGSMFFGGAFEGINFMDILLFAGIAFLLFKLFSARGREQAPRPATAGQASHGIDPVYQRNAEPAQAQSSAGFDTDVMGKRGDGTSFKPSAAPAPFPADFDSAAFLVSAKAAYTHLQRAWDEGDLAELRGLCTDNVFGELQDQIKQREGSNITEVLKVDARLLEVKDVGGDREAVVLFDVLMRESTDDELPEQVQEVWHFIRARSSNQPTWFLDGIQQLAD
jgi:predicted lipid-binding transport protein (Tim44 family)